MKKIIHIEGMGCEKCAAHVHEALMSLKSVSDAEVSLSKNCALVTLSGDVTDSEFKEVIEEAGYEVSKIEAA